MFKRQVFSTLQFEGIHAWSECDVAGVEFLRHPHRHMFHVKATVTVNHNDRDQEFIDLKRQIRTYLHDAYPSSDYVLYLNDTSCEMIAEDLCTQFNLDSCEISEDGENGAIVTNFGQTF